MLLGYSIYSLIPIKEVQSLPNCYHTAFYPYFYSFYSLQSSIPFHPLISVGMSSTRGHIIFIQCLCVTMVQSLSAISKLISGLAFQLSPILLDNLLEDSSSRRQYSKNLSYFILNTKFYKNIILPVPPNNMVPLGTPYTSHNSYPCTIADYNPGQLL